MVKVINKNILLHASTLEVYYWYLVDRMKELTEFKKHETKLSELKDIGPWNRSSG